MERMHAAPPAGTVDAPRTPGAATPRNHLVARIGTATLAILLAAALVMFAWAQAGDSAAPVQQPGGTMDADVQPTALGQRRPAPVDPPNLPSLLGATRQEALAKIGHGAAVRAEEPGVSQGAPCTKLAVALADVRSKDGPGAPMVLLWLDESGAVVEARYSAALRFSGFPGGIPFRMALDESHVVQAVLADAGVRVAPEDARCPGDAAAYSTYGDDGRTLVREHAEFAGTGARTGAGMAGEGPIGWTACLDYDYTEANASGNLVYTRRILAVGVHS